MSYPNSYSSSEKKYFQQTWSTRTSIPLLLKSGATKNRRGFVDTLSDKCLCNHGIENTKHFLFSCSFFTIQRATLRASVVKILQKYNLNNLRNNLRLYLYGHRTISFADNRKILLSTIAFIKDTRRFLV